MVRCDSYELLAAQPSSMEWNKGTTKATVNVDLAEVGGTVKSLSYSAQVCCCWDSSGSWSPQAKVKFLYQMDLTAEYYAMIAADVLYRGKGVTLLVSHTWILEGNIRSTIGCDS